MDIAGYSKMTKTSEVVSSLREEITERAGLMLAMNAPKAAFGIVDVLDDPSSLRAPRLGRASHHWLHGRGPGRPARRW